jgi:phosphopantothenoylcysteine decarboxylase/phosphopantothenate--cysteine ligase
LDEVRRLTNQSTGRLGTELARFLTARGHETTLLIGEQASYRGDPHAGKAETFTTTSSLSDRLRAFARQPADAVFHAAAVSDFGFGKIWRRSPEGELTEVRAGKLSTRQGTLLAELTPTPKIIAELRQWFPRARLVGWKYEVEGNRPGAIQLAERQIIECRTDACVANGPAYGTGFGLVRSGGETSHLPDKAALFSALEKLICEPRHAPSAGG